MSHDLSTPKSSPTTKEKNKAPTTLPKENLNSTTRSPATSQQKSRLPVAMPTCSISSSSPSQAINKTLFMTNKSRLKSLTSPPKSSSSSSSTLNQNTTETTQNTSKSGYILASAPPKKINTRPSTTGKLPGSSMRQPRLGQKHLKYNIKISPLHLIQQVERMLNHL